MVLKGVLQKRPTEIAAECIAVILSEIPMNYEFHQVVRERAKDLIKRRSQKLGEGPRLSNSDHETAARLVAGMSMYYMYASECEAVLDEVFLKAQRIKAELDSITSTRDHLEWLEVAADVRGTKK